MHSVAQFMKLTKEFFAAPAASVPIPQSPRQDCRAVPKCY